MSASGVVNNPSGKTGIKAGNSLPIEPLFLPKRFRWPRSAHVLKRERGRGLHVQTLPGGKVVSFDVRRSTAVYCSPPPTLEGEVDRERAREQLRCHRWSRERHFTFLHAWDMDDGCGSSLRYCAGGA